MLVIKEFLQDDISLLLSWLENTDRKFLVQFSGPVYKFPLTEEQLSCDIKKAATDKDRMLFKCIDTDINQTIGHCQLLKINYADKTARIGRVLIAPELRRKNYGTKLIDALLNYSFTVLGFEELNLGVFDFNIPAFNCYIKAGFIEYEKIDMNFESIGETWKIIRMKINRQSYLKKTAYGAS